MQHKSKLHHYFWNKHISGIKCIHLLACLCFLLSSKVCLKAQSSSSWEQYFLLPKYLDSETKISEYTYLGIDSSSVCGQKTRSGEIKFKPLGQFDYNIPNFINPHYCYWIRIHFINRDSLAHDFLLSAGNFYKTNLSVYSRDSLLSYNASSQFERPSQRAYRYDYQYHPITIGPKDTLALIMEIQADIGNKSSMDPHIISHESEAVKRVGYLYDDYFAISLNHAMIGILGFLGFFFLSQFVLTKEKFMLYYSLYLIAMMFYGIYGFSHSPYVVHLLSYSHFLNFTLQQNIYVIVTHIFYYLFIASILEFRRQLSLKLYRGIRVIFLLLLITLGLEFLFSVMGLDNQFHRMYGVFVQLLLSVLNIVLLLLVFQIKGRVSLYVKIGSVLIFIGAIGGFISSKFQLIQTSSPLFEHYPNVFFIYAVLLECFFFSLATGQRTFQILRERDYFKQNLAVSELDKLRTQLKPHFIFNILNSLKSFILLDKKQEALEYLSEFSILTRTILEKTKSEFISIAEEVQFLEHYIKLEQRRFNDQFSFKIVIDPSIDSDLYKIPSFLLQPIVENCIKHGFNGQNISIALIEISVEKKENSILIRIQDNGIGRHKSIAQKSTYQMHQALGVSLTEQRISKIKELYGIEISMNIEDLDSNSGTLVTFILPFID